jgi:hypothetical protein
MLPIQKNVELGAPEDNPVESPVKLYASASYMQSVVIGNLLTKIFP